MHNCFDLLDTDVMPIFMIIALDIFITMHFSINCSAVICSPTVIHAIMREATSETYGPRSHSYYITSLLLSHLVYYFAIFTFQSIQKNTKNIYLTISIISHCRKWLWRDCQPLYRLGCEVLVCLCRYEGILRSLLLDWYLVSQKLWEILTLLCCITLSSSRENQRMLKR